MTKSPRVGFGGKRGLFWVLIASWVIPLMMALAYVILVMTSDVDATGASWEAMAFGFVLVLWFLFRVLTEGAAMARAIGVGDTDRVLELADFQLARRRSPRRRAPFHVYRALAFEIRGEWPAALAELEHAGPATGAWRGVAETVRVAALAETGRVAEARAAFTAGLRPPLPRDLSVDILARLAEARLLLAEGDRDGADKLLARLVDDVRAGSGIRERARALQARVRAA